MFEGKPGLELATYLSKALEKIPDQVEFQPLNSHGYDCARANDKRPAKMSFYTSDDWVKNIRGNQNLVDLYLAIRIPREFIEELRAKWKSEKGESKSAEPGDPVPSQDQVDPAIPTP